MLAVAGEDEFPDINIIIGMYVYKDQSALIHLMSTPCNGGSPEWNMMHE